MQLYLSQFLASLVSVFFKGFQHQNVIGGHYKAAFVFSYIMAAIDVVIIGLVVKGGWWSILPVGTGAAIGIVSSMYLYRKKHNVGKGDKNG